MGAWWICGSGFPPWSFVHTFVIRDNTMHQESLQNTNTKITASLSGKNPLETLFCFIFVVAVFHSFNTVSALSPPNGTSGFHPLFVAPASSILFLKLAS